MLESVKSANFGIYSNHINLIFIYKYYYLYSILLFIIAISAKERFLLNRLTRLEKQLNLLLFTG